ncbi:hypothetical protein, partial [Salmonella enterica]|uniref:hypothetical protein n=1 Tax=Salmonella enterica TaxID=28901 RepID=UPI00398C789C
MDKQRCVGKPPVAVWRAATRYCQEARSLLHLLRQRELQSGVPQGRGLAAAGLAHHHEPRQRILKPFALSDFPPAPHTPPQLPHLHDGLRHTMVYVPHLARHFP